MSNSIKTNYYSCLNNELDTLLTNAQNDLMNNYYIIVDNPKYMEEILLKKKDTLFNIEIMNYHNLTRKLLTDYSLYNYQMVNEFDGILLLYKTLNDNPNNYYSQAINYLSMQSLLNTLKELSLSNYNLDDKHSSKKVIDLLEVFKLFNEGLDDNHYLSSEKIILANLQENNDHYLFIDYPSNNLTKELISALDQKCNIKVLTDDASDTDKVYSTIDFSIITGDNIYDEVNKVTLDLYKNLIDNDLSPKDFVIYYPNDDYLDILSTNLNKLHLPFKQSTKYPNKAYLAIISLLKYYLFNDDNYLNEFLHAGFVEKDDITLNKPEEKATIKEYSETLLAFIKDNFNLNEEVNKLISYLSELTNNDYVTLKFYLDILINKPLVNTETNDEYNDSIYLLKYNQPYGKLLGCKYSYLVGNNSTINPLEVKNNDLLLDNEKELLNINPSYLKSLEYEYDILHTLSNNCDYNVISYCFTSIQGDQLLPSKYLQKLLQSRKDVKTITTFIGTNKLLENYYLNNYQASKEETLNSMLGNYKSNNNQVDKLEAGTSNIMSPSSLEEYNKCPFKFFINRRLRLQEVKTGELDVRDFGNIAHHVFQIIARDLSKLNYSTLDKTISNIIDKYIIDNSLAHTPINDYYYRLLKEHLYNVVIVLDKQLKKGKFEVGNLEQKIVSNIGDYKLSGRIDRGDIYAEAPNKYIKIIDYKSSSKKLDLDLAKIGFNMQMLLYLNALVKDSYKIGAVLYFSFNYAILDNKSITPEAFENLFKMEGYTSTNVANKIDSELDDAGTSSIIKVKIKNVEYINNVLSETDFQTLLDDVETYVLSLYKQQASGDISVYPTKSENNSINGIVNACTYCKFKGLCNYDVFYNKDHKINSKKEFIKEED